MTKEVSKMRRGLLDMLVLSIPVPLLLLSQSLAHFQADSKRLNII